MSERNYYVICDDNCKFPSMTAEQILEAIAEATGETPVHIDDAFITKIREQNKSNDLKFWVGTQAQYNALEEPESGVFYIITDADPLEDIQTDIAELQASIAAIDTLQKKDFVIEALYAEASNSLTNISHYTKEELTAAIDAGKRIIVKAEKSPAGSLDFYYLPLENYFFVNDEIIAIFRLDLSDRIIRFNYGELAFSRRSIRQVLPNVTASDNGKIIRVVDGEWAKTAEADYIVERGTNGDWTYKKYASGDIECYGAIETSFDITTASGQEYIGEADYSLPQGLFVSAEFVNATHLYNDEGEVIDLFQANVGLEELHFRVKCASSYTGIRVGIAVDIKGRWKE